ncbi:MAG: D-alanyl-D-alanine carboxypeptidase/D-alanyl-D-alanine-endopeptidase [Ignavibacteriaceae bacterium]
MIKNFLLCFIFISHLSFASSVDVIRNKIQNIIDQLPNGVKIGMLIYNPLTQDTIFQVDPAISMIPASNTKLFTTAVALSYLGGDFPLCTKLFTDDNNIEDGIINGNLYIKGFGNSVFTRRDLEEMITELKQKGIKKITGNIIGDDSYFDNVYTRDDWIKDEVANVNLPPVSAIIIDRNKTRIKRTVRKRIRYYTASISDPPEYAAKLLKDMLKENGIEIIGTSQKGITPSNPNLLSEKNILLRDLVNLINKHSDNYLAECLFKTIGAEVSGIQGNSFYSTQAILSFIRDNAIFSKGTAVVDGSGISRFNQITPGAIAGILEKMYFDLPNYEDFYNSLSIAGVDGTLRNRMDGSFAANNFHGKTGSLNGVSSISGYLTTKHDDDDLIISIMFEFNRGSWNYYRSIQDKIIETLAEWN